MPKILVVAIKGSPVERTHVNRFFVIQFLPLDLFTPDDYFFTIGRLLEPSGLLLEGLAPRWYYLRVVLSISYCIDRVASQFTLILCENLLFEVFTEDHDNGCVLAEASDVDWSVT